MKQIMEISIKNEIKMIGDGFIFEKLKTLTLKAIFLALIKKVGIHPWYYTDERF